MARDRSTSPALLLHPIPRLISPSPYPSIQGDLDYKHRQLPEYLRGPGLYKAFCRGCYFIVTIPHFEFFNAMVIFVNAIVLGLNWWVVPAQCAIRK